MHDKLKALIDSRGLPQRTTSSAWQLHLHAFHSFVHCGSLLGPLSLGGHIFHAMFPELFRLAPILKQQIAAQEWKNPSKFNFTVNFTVSIRMDSLEICTKNDKIVKLTRIE